jgi:hypothetical protein
MVTDGRGYPLEFRATTPVKPSLVQRTLWGSKLEQYVGVELCGNSLLNSSQRKPRNILVPNVGLLGIGDEASPNVIAVWRSGEAMQVESPESGGASRGNINPHEGPYQPLVYQGMFRDSESEQQTLALLDECAVSFDLAEAFDRMRAALRLLPKEDARYA